MFQHCAYRQTLREIAALTALTNLDFSPGDTRGGALFVVVNLTGTTVGSVDVQILGSFNEVAYFDLGTAAEANFARTGLSSTGFYYFELTGTLPPHLRVELTPQGGMNGQVGVVARAQVRLETDFG